MSRGEMNQGVDAAALDPGWSLLNKLAGAAALITVALIPIQIVVFIAIPPPGFQPTSSTVAGWFALLHNHRFLGLLDLDLILIIDQVLAIPIALALYVVLRKVNHSLMAIATAFSLVAIAAYLAANGAFSMLSLSEQYAAATTEAQRSLVLAAGLAVFSTHTGTAFQVSYILGSIALLITSLVILRGNVFTRVTASMGILSSVIGLGLFVPKIGIFLSFVSVPFLMIWDILIARKFFQLARSGSAKFSADNG